MNGLYSKLIELNVGKVLKNETMANHTTLKIGGPADLFIEPSSIDNLIKTMELIRQYDIKWTVIGRGSNLLVSDRGIEGAVIKLGQGLASLEINGLEVRVGGGYSLISLATLISRKGLSGLEFASGIPGSVGGAVYMNAGAHGSDISKVLKSARILFADGTIEWIENKEMEFSYRTSILQKKRPGIVLEAVFQVVEGDREKIFAAVQKYKDYRRETQPWDHRCAGSIFRNPLPEYAGRLIEEAGLKGYSIGGAQVSEKHANFIVNTGNATADDVLKLIQHIKDVIYKNKNIVMETEVEIIGRM